MALEAELAHAVGPAEPGDPDPVAGAEAAAATAAGHDLADHLVAGHEQQLRVGQLAVNHVQVRPAHRAGEHPHQHLARARLEVGQVGGAQPAPGSVEHHGPHS